MKLTWLLILIICLHSTASVWSQTTSISLKATNTSLQELFITIENKTGYRFFYNNDEVDVSQEVTVSVSDKPVGDILTQAFKDLPYSFREVGNKLILVERNINKEKEAGTQQKKKVTGTVVDSSGSPLPGVSVVVKGTPNGTITDSEGNFSHSDIPKNATLVFSFVGMKTQEIAVEGNTEISVKLEEDAIGIEEVVAIGYGVEKKVNVIGSVTSISNDEISLAPVANVTNALAGRLPGAIVQQRSGEPGRDGASITIRGNATLGNNSPLVVVDGIPGRHLGSIEPNDIESISVLKDASAAIYGARAANGVILITTKRGKEGRKPTLSYDYYSGWNTPTILPKMTDAPTYAQMIRETQSYRGVAESNMQFSLDDIEKYKSGNMPWLYPNTIWYDAALAKYSNSSHHNFSINGGSENIAYYLSFGAQSDDGIYKESATSFNRYNVRTNVDVKLNKYLSVAFDISGSMEDKMYSTRPTDYTWGTLIRMRPTDVAVFPNGVPGPDIERGDQPVVSAGFDAGFDDNKTYRSNNMVTASFKVPGVEGLSLSGYYAYDLIFNVRKFFEKSHTLYQLDKSAYKAAGNTGSEDGSAFLVGYQAGVTDPQLTDYYNDYTTKTLNFKVSYETKINDLHQMSAFVAYESSDYKAKGIEAFRRYFISDKSPYLDAGGSDSKDNGSWLDIDGRINYFGRISYNYDDKYLLQFSLRRDGSLQFSKEHGRWGTFPSVLAGWRISNENFWKNNLSFINYFKLKASWGQMGNDQVDPFQYLSNFAFGNGTILGASKSYQSGLYLSNTPNPTITWEVGNIVNIGFESMFLNNKASLNVDLFHERRTNILVKKDASVPSFTGLSLPDENFGIVENQGIEINMGYADKAGKLSYDVNGFFAFARNKIIEFDEPAKNVEWQILTGHPQGSTLLYKSIGIFNDQADIDAYPHVSGAKPGDIIIEDFNGDEKITSDDKVLFDKNANPEITFGLNLSFKYKNWKLTSLVQGVARAMTYAQYNIQGSGGNYFDYDANGRWTPDNITSVKPRAFEREEEYWRGGSYRTDYFYQDASYARLKNLQLSYAIPVRICKKVLLKKATAYVSGQNLFLLYNKNHYVDPELTSLVAYPIMKVYALGINVAF